MSKPLRRVQIQSEIEQMKVAVLILTHKDASHLKRLVHSMDHPSIDFFVHIDKKNIAHEFPNITEELNKPNIHFITSQKVYWASISQTEARLRLINAAVKHDEFNHFIMLSGQCYPTKPVSKLLNYLSNNMEASFMEHFSLPYDNLGVNKGLDRINCYSYTILGKKVTYFSKDMKTTFNSKGKVINSLLGLLHIFIKERIHPKNVKPYYGIDWWVLSNSAAKYILKFVDKNPKFHSFHKHTRHTSEIYFPSILAGSNYNGEIINKSLHYMQWSKVNSAHPIVLTKEDYQSISKSEAFFARKFETKKSGSLLSLIDNKLIRNEG